MVMDRQGIGTTQLYTATCLSVSLKSTQGKPAGRAHTAPAPRERLAAQYLHNARGRGSSGEGIAFYL